MGDRVAFYILLVIAAVAFQQYRDGRLGDWAKSKFWNTAEPAPGGWGWAAALGSTSAALGSVAPASVAGATAPGIVSVAGISGGVHTSIAPRVRAMIAAAAADGVTLTGGGYRSSARQAELRRINGCPDLTSPSSTCKVPTAPVGRSEHEKGLAIDFDGARTEGTTVHRWLVANAARYGLHQLPSEAWHWSTTGR